MPAEGITYEGRDLEALSGLDNYYDWIVDAFRPHLAGRGVEFGPGIGTISQRILPHLASLDLVEPSANLVGELGRRFAAYPNVAILPGTFEERAAEFAAGSRDVAVLVNVLEHIEDDGAALAQLHRLLAPGGRLLIFVPALQWLFSAFDGKVGHFRRYHRRPLIDLARSAGFEIVEARYCDALGILPWALFNTLLGKTDIDPRMARLYDRFAVPLTRRLEAWIRPPLGKNILLVARKQDPAP